MKVFVLIIIILAFVVSCKFNKAEKKVTLDITGFNVSSMVKYTENEIKKFSKDHKDEVFYAFAIDDGLLCLNSESMFNFTLKEYKKKYPDDYKNKEEIENLKYNTGDWKYQGFSFLTESAGYNDKMFQKFYDLGFYGGADDVLENTEYYKAMKELLAGLEKNKAFDCLKKSDDFKVFIIKGND